MLKEANNCHSTWQFQMSIPAISENSNIKTFLLGSCLRSPYSRFEIQHLPFPFLCTVASIGTIQDFAIASILYQVQAWREKHCLLIPI